MSHDMVRVMMSSSPTVSVWIGGDIARRSVWMVAETVGFAHTTRFLLYTDRKHHVGSMIPSATRTCRADETD